MKRIAKFCLLGLVNLGIIFLVVEIGLRINTSISPIYDLEMHKYATKLKRPGSVPGLVHEHIPNSSATLMGVDFKINSMGFRDDELQLVDGKPDYKILVLGCSNTVGWGVKYEQVFTSLLERDLNPEGEDTAFHVINAGVGNYNSTLESIQLDQKIEEIMPNKVVLHYYINDAEIINAEKTNIFVRNSFLIALLKNRSKYDKFSSRFEDVGSYYKSLYQLDNPGWLAAQQAILHMQKVCADLGVTFQVLIQPDLHDLSDGSEQFRCHEIIRSFLASNDILFADLFISYQYALGEDKKEFWVNSDDAHPNALGHQIIVDCCFEFLRP
ncbi:MAG: hypothetical protein JKX74_05240 [Flavobacteriales bacterium]|nr:hypothetical protein [Flavobacteriales bacterium]